MAFSFAFSGDDIDADQADAPAQTNRPALNSAFPVPGKPQLPPTSHHLSQLLSRLPSKIAYSLLDISLDDGSVMQLPRRELWDVRMQIMAEDEDREDGAEGLGEHDVKTGVYEGGFKSWESSVDLVKVLAVEDNLVSHPDRELIRYIELGCGTALPSLAVFQWIMKTEPQIRRPATFVAADYNPTVLELVTLPNFLLTWAIQHPETPALSNAFTIEGELELSPEVLDAFQTYLNNSNITLAFLSGAWSLELIQLIDALPKQPTTSDTSVTLLLGAETIYSPFALQAFTEIVMVFLRDESKLAGAKSIAYVAAKRLYFGVGGSLDDFIVETRRQGAVVTTVREETEGVRRGVVRCTIETGSQSDLSSRNL